MEATASAAPSQGAGTGSAQSDSPSSSAKGGNSSAQTSPAQRPQGAALPSSPSDNSNDTGDAKRGPDGKFLPKDGAAPKQAAAPVDDDPEFDFGEGKKAKRSQVLKDFNRMRQAQAAEARRAQEAHQRHEAFTASLKKQGIDPERFAQDPDAAFQEAYHARIQRMIEEAQMDPRELELKKREETIAEYEARIKAEADARTKEEHTARVQARADEFASDMHAALEASNLPRNPQTIARMASLMLAAARKGTQIPKEQLATIVAKQVSAEQEFYDSQIDSTETAANRMQTLLSRFDGDAAALAKALGTKRMDDLRKLILQEAQSKFSPKQPQQPQPRAAKLPDIPTRSHKTYHTLDEWKAWQESKDAPAKARR